MQKMNEENCMTCKGCRFRMDGEWCMEWEQQKNE